MYINVEEKFVKKCLIGLTIIMFYSFFSLFAVETGSVEFKYWFINEVSESVSDMYFTNTSKQRIDACPLDVASSLNDPQLYAAVYSNVSATNYSVTLSFSTLKKTDENKYGYYKAKVYRLSDLGTLSEISYDNIESRTIEVTNNESPTSVSFPLDKTQNSTNQTFYYPIAFQFSDYIGSYENGSYSGTILIEVAAT